MDTPQRGSVVTFSSGPGFGLPQGGVFSGKVKSVYPDGKVFVETDVPVPCVLGRGTELEWWTTHEGVWMHTRDLLTCEPPAPFVPPYLRSKP